jgi:hypothetical protein
MAEENINFDEIYFETLASLNVPEYFDCGDNDLNGFLLDDALSYSNDGIATTTLVIYKDRIIAYFALCSDSIRLIWKEKKADTKIYYPEYPALKVARLAVASNFKRKGIGISC